MSFVQRLRDLVTRKPRGDEPSALRDEPTKRNPGGLPSSGAVQRPPNSGLGGGPT